MGALDFFNHLANLLFVPLVLAAFAAAFAKLAWRRELGGISWWRLAWPAALANVLVAMFALALFVRDGKMAAYGTMVLASALTLWWRGFLARRA
jgi:hypothetical protein